MNLPASSTIALRVNHSEFSAKSYRRRSKRKRDLEHRRNHIGDRNITILSDEIYSRLIFNGEHFSILSVPGFKDRTILLDGFSKSYAMTEWRMGYGVMRPDLAAHITRLMTNSNSCTASFTQIAGSVGRQDAR